MERIGTHIRLSRELHATLQAEAERLGISINALLTTLVAEWADRKRSH